VGDEVWGEESLCEFLVVTTATVETTTITPKAPTTDSTIFFAWNTNSCLFIQSKDLKNYLLSRGILGFSHETGILSGQNAKVSRNQSVGVNE
jgi:hypothetical protein